VKFDVRDYRREDFSTLYQIDQVCFPKEIAYTRFELAYYMRRREAFTLVATARQPKASSKSKPPEEEAAGFIVAERREMLGHIITIDVLPKFRRHGLGSLLLGAAEKRLRESGSTEVELETATDNAAAHAFYKLHGYAQTGTLPDYYPNGLGALVMKKNLLPKGQIANVQT
jgi:ribosomal-protein-alanine N-acetyltransferase